MQKEGIMGFAFGNKIKLNDDIENFIISFKNTNWFINCGTKYNKKLYFNYISEENIKNVSRHLSQKNHGDFKNIEELFGVADSRLNWFFEKNIKKEQTTRNKLTDVINKRFSNNMEIDFNEIGKEYCKIFSLSNQRYNWFYWIFFAIIIEMYFKNYGKYEMHY